MDTNYLLPSDLQKSGDEHKLLKYILRKRDCGENRSIILHETHLFFTAAESIYRVFRQLANLGLVVLDVVMFLMFHHLAQPFLPKYNLPKQNRADSGTPKIKVNPNKVRELMEHPVPSDRPRKYDF